MRKLQQAKLLAHLVHWRLTWGRHDSDYVPAGLGQRFVSARTVADRIIDGSVVISCGIGGNARCSSFFWAVSERFRQTGHPRGLTWISVAGQGGRGRVPGTVEELGFPGLLRRYIAGHVETAKSLLALADRGELELYTMPQGQLAALLEAQARGELEVRSEVGVGTFLDPRVGPGAGLSPESTEPFIRADGDALVYRLPRIDVALFNAPWADAEANLYFGEAATLTESIEAARVARRNGGMVAAVVADVVPRRPDQVSLAAGTADAIVVNPHNEQTASVPQRRYWRMFTAGAQIEPGESIVQLRFINRLLRITPLRGPAQQALVRLAASLFVTVVPRRAVVNIGIGLPEEVCRLIYENGLHRELTFTSESGVYGGLPAPGVFFGACVAPERLESSGWMFRFYQQHLDVAVLGFLQVDSHGNVNVSRRGAAASQCVGPGGFPDIAASARTLLFVGTWMNRAGISIHAGRLAIDRPGVPKFRAAVDEITLSGPEALRHGKRVFYVTDVGVFRLTERGLELAQLVAGVDVQRDILDACDARIVLPDGGSVPVVDRSVLTGEGFELRWKKMKNPAAAGP